MTHTTAEHDMAANELDRVHEEFLAEIVHLDSKAAQRLFKRIAEAGEDSTPVLNGDRQQHSASAR